MSGLPEGTWALLRPDGTTSLRQTAAPPGAPPDVQGEHGHGERGPEDRGAIVAALTDAPDAIVRRRLVALGRGFAWHAGGDEAIASQIDTLRDDLASLRAFGSLLACPLLPESAVNIAHQLARDLPEGTAVLAHEGQAFVGLALARLGHHVTLWTDDEPLLALAARLANDLPLQAVTSPLATPLAERLVGQHALVLVDTLREERGTSALLCRAQHAVAAGGRVVALSHPMRRAHTEACAAQAGLALDVPLDEIGVRLLCGFSPAEFVWDERIFVVSGTPAVALADDVSEREGRELDPRERKHGCVEVLALAEQGLTAARVDRAVALFASADGEPLATDGFDEEGVQHVRHLALGQGAHAAFTVRVQDGHAAVDLFPWSPARLLRLCAALLTELPRAAEEVPLGG